MAKKNQVGNWGRKTKPTQGASVNTPRHCSEMVIYFLRLLAARQAVENFQLFDPNPAFSCDNSACRFFQLDIRLKFLNFVITYRHVSSRIVTYRHRCDLTMKVRSNTGTVVFIEFAQLIFSKKCLNIQVNPVVEYLCMSDILSSPKIHRQRYRPCAQYV